MTVEPASTRANRINSDSLDWSYIGISFTVGHSTGVRGGDPRLIHRLPRPDGRRWPALRQPGGCGANVVGRAIRGLEVGTGHAASTAFQISEAVLFLTRSLPSL